MEQKSRLFQWIIFGILEVIIILLVFRIGTVVGFYKASHTLQSGNNYEQLFGMGRGMMQQFDKDDYAPAHGVSGSILKVDGSTILINSRDNTEKSVILTPTTIIRNRQNMMTELKENERIVVIGSPSSSGQIEAKLIRIFAE